MNGCNGYESRIPDNMEPAESAVQELTEHQYNMYANYRIVNDSVHGQIALHRLCWTIVDTEEFQRLRNIKQLGVAYLVYPGAIHTRFDHSLGVCHLAREMVKYLEENDKKWDSKFRLFIGKNKIKPVEKLCIEIAGLCHDLGHGPFSHTWERVVRRWKGNWEHETASQDIICHIYERRKKSFHQDGIGDLEIEFIQKLISGYKNDDDGPYCSPEKQFLFEIISNKFNEFDVDKWDYLLRDAQHLNLNLTFNHKRLLNFCGVVQVENDGKITTHIGYNVKIVKDLYDMVRMRAEYHRKAYQHRVVKGIETMFIDAFASSGNNGYLVNGDKLLREAHLDYKSLLELTDHIFYDILFSHNNEEAKYAKSIFKMICNRDIYDIIDVFKVKGKNAVTRAEKIVEDLKTNFENDMENIQIELVQLSLGCFENPKNWNKIIIFKPNVKNEPVLLNYEDSMVDYDYEQFPQCHIMVFNKKKNENNSAVKLYLENIKHKRINSTQS
uniref:HD/PDEase domain-containing protein n=1 Tax=Clastoptera arizonana TaxID=38151 RepID=A0A1B6DWI5_9HEMI